MRVVDHPILGTMPRRETVRFQFNGCEYSAFEGESIAAALLANGIRVLRLSERGEPRGVYCGIGHCYECRVTVDKIPSIRACITPVKSGMIIQSQGSVDDEC
jgi:sarcosine oxidase subunit alpha